jgi:hypothetical protein
MIRDLGEVRTRIADATNALNQGIIYEESRPVRMGLLTGRSAELKKQGLAHVGALQATAEIIKGNIELARAYADDSLSAIRADNAEKNQALNTLLEMENANLIRLTKEEKDTIAERRDLLEKESARLEKDKDALLNLAMKNPNAFTKGNVLFTDTPQQAFQKMSPHLAEMERLQLEREMLELEEIRSRIDENKAQALKAIRGGRAGGGGGGGGATGDGTTITGQIFSAAEYLASQGYSQAEIRVALGKQFAGKMKDSALFSAIDNALQGFKDAQAQKPTTPADVLKQIESTKKLEELGFTATGEAIPKKPGFMQRAKSRIKNFFSRPAPPTSPPSEGGGYSSGGTIRG